MKTGTELCRIAKKWGTDKVDSAYHDYTPYYHDLFRGRDVRRLLEFGIGNAATNMSHVPNYTTGASLRMWEEYFPQAEIFGLDNDPSILINEGRVHSFLCEQGSDASLLNMGQYLELGGKFDVIIDDALHHPPYQVATAKIFIPMLLKPDGIYVIEDVWDFDYVIHNLPYTHEVVNFVPRRHACDRLIVIKGAWLW